MPIKTGSESKLHQHLRYEFHDIIRINCEIKNGPMVGHFGRLLGVHVVASNGTKIDDVDPPFP